MARLPTKILNYNCSTRRRYNFATRCQTTGLRKNGQMRYPARWTTRRISHALCSQHPQIAMSIRVRR